MKNPTDDFYANKLLAFLKERELTAKRVPISTKSNFDVEVSLNVTINIEVKHIDDKPLTCVCEGVYTKLKDGKPAEDLLSIRNSITGSICKKQLPQSGNNLFWFYVPIDVDKDEFEDVLFPKKVNGAKYDGLFHKQWNCTNGQTEHNLNHIDAIIAYFNKKRIVAFINPNKKSTLTKTQLKQLGVTEIIFLSLENTSNSFLKNLKNESIAALENSSDIIIALSIATILFGISQVLANYLPLAIVLTGLIMWGISTQLKKYAKKNARIAL